MPLQTSDKENISLLCDLLEARAQLDPDDLARARQLSDERAQTIDKTLIRLGLISEAALMPILADFFQLRFFGSPEDLRLDQEITAQLGQAYCLANSFAIVTDLDETRYLLFQAPFNEALIREINFHLERRFELALSTTEHIGTLLTPNEPEKGAKGVYQSELLEADDEALARFDEDGPAIRAADEIIQNAINKGASDIHLEPQLRGLRIRFRIEGTLTTFAVPQQAETASILARFKVLAGMNVSERRLPQDGRMTATVAGRKIDFRVASVPTSFGESIVARILDPKMLRLGWDDLGFNKRVKTQLIKLIERPSGLFLVTGPTGSGKTTTLYTALDHLNDSRRKILTVEDPVEYNLEGIEQVQTKEEIGMSFARALRSFLRQDPDVIMIGEIRDQETAEIACRAAMVGRLVLSTLHTRQPEDAAKRLIDLGVQDYIVHDVLIGVLGQRLIQQKNQKRKLVPRLYIAGTSREPGRKS